MASALITAFDDFVRGQAVLSANTEKGKNTDRIHRITCKVFSAFPLLPSEFAKFVSKQENHVQKYKGLQQEVSKLRVCSHIPNSLV